VFTFTIKLAKISDVEVFLKSLDTPPDSETIKTVTMHHWKRFTVIYTLFVVTDKFDYYTPSNKVSIGIPPGYCVVGYYVDNISDTIPFPTIPLKVQNEKS